MYPDIYIHPITNQIVNIGNRGISTSLREFVEKIRLIEGLVAAQTLPTSLTTTSSSSPTTKEIRVLSNAAGELKKITLKSFLKLPKKDRNLFIDIQEKRLQLLDQRSSAGLIGDKQELAKLIEISERIIKDIRGVIKGFDPNSDSYRGTRILSLGTEIQMYVYYKDQLEGKNHVIDTFPVVGVSVNDNKEYEITLLG